MNQLQQKPIRYPKKGNPFYPLHPDYPKLSPDEQKESRLNALFLQESPTDLVWAWSFFRNYYLRQTAPGFFYKRFKPSPPFHYQIIEDVGRYPFNAVAAPRASAKSTVLAIELPLLLLLTRPYFNILLVLSKDTMVTKRMNTQIGYQLQRNPFIQEDFGSVRPPKGQGVWNAHMMQLPNGATIESCSVMGGMLGARPDLILVDDPEIDPVMNRVTTELRENYERFLLNHIVPMLDEGGSSLYWIGTLLSKQCFLYYVVTNQTDDRFKFWNRRLLDAEDDGRGGLLWEAKWSRDTLDEDKIRMGAAAYNAQRRNRPGTAEEQVLALHPELNQYTVEGAVDPDNPLNSPAILKTHVRLGHHHDTGAAVTKPLERPYGEVVSKMFRVLTMDYARCLSPTSDFIAMSVVGVENTKHYTNTWYHLDLFVGRLQGEAWIRKFWELALRWRVQYAGIEAVAAQSTLVNTARDHAEEAANLAGWVPRIVPIRYPNGLSKEDRMGSLQWRFNQRKIMYPLHLKNTWPYKELYYETEGFTGMPGGTQYDDALDSLAMVQFLVRGGRRAIQDENWRGAYNLVDELDRGNRTLDNGLQTGLGLNMNDVPMEIINKLMHNTHEESQRPVGRRGPCIQTL